MDVFGLRNACNRPARYITWSPRPITSVQRLEYKCGARTPIRGASIGSILLQGSISDPPSSTMNKKKYIFCMESWYYVLFLVKIYLY